MQWDTWIGIAKRRILTEMDTTVACPNPIWKKPPCRSRAQAANICPPMGDYYFGLEGGSPETEISSLESTSKRDKKAEQSIHKMDNASEKGQESMDEFAEDFENTGDIFGFDKEDDFLEEVFLSRTTPTPRGAAQKETPRPRATAQEKTTPRETAQEDVTTYPCGLVTKLSDTIILNEDMEKVRGMCKPKLTVVNVQWEKSGAI
jgi:hypothetical protein